MTRYNLDKNIKNRYDGKRFFGTRSYPKIESHETDVIYGRLSVTPGLQLRIPDSSRTAIILSNFNKLNG